MATGQLNGVIQHLRRAMVLRDGAGLTDGQLLRDYISRREEAALAALVQRHAPMVWGVCRRVLSSYHDAEDAFQATFLVLVRRAVSISPPELVGNWLYGVAHQTAMKARSTVAKRKRRERQVTQMPEPAVLEQDLWNDVRPLLDQELSSLPDISRVVIVLCDLEGKTRSEAARHLGLPEGTVASRLARARTMLAKRLAQRGVVLSGATLAAVLAQNFASAGVPASVVSSTIYAASLFATGNVAASVVSAKVASLTEGVLRTMLMSKLKAVVAVMLLLAFIGTGVTVLTSGAMAKCERQPAAEGPVKEQPKQKPTPEKEAFTAWGKEEADFEIAGRVSAAAYSRDGKWLALARSDTNTVTLYDTSSAKKIHTFEGMRGVSHAIVFSADGAKIYAASNEGIVFSWNTKTGKAEAKLNAKAGMCYGLTLSPDGKLLASGHHDQEQVKSTIHVWDEAAGKLVRTIASDEFVLPNTIAFSSNGKAIAGGYHASHKKVPDLAGFHGVIEWDLITGKETKRYDTPRITLTAVPIAHAIAYTPDGKWLIVGGGEAVPTGPEKCSLYGYVWLFDRKTAKLEKTLVSDRSDYVRLLSLSPDGSKLYVPASSLSHRAPENRFQNVRLDEFQCWDTASWERNWTYTNEKPMSVTSIAVFPNGTRVGVADSNGFKLLDAKTGQPRGGVVPEPQTDGRR